MQHLRDSFKVSERHACELVGIAVSTFRYHKEADDEGLRQQLINLAREKAAVRLSAFACTSQADRRKGES